MSNWQTVTLEDVAESINTGLDAIRRAPIVEHQTNLRCLRIQDISQNKPFDKWGYTEVKDSDFKKFQLVPNDIIMARTCSTGICYLVKKELPAVFNNGLARIRLKIEKVDPKFIYYVFKSKHFSGYIDGISGGTSVQLNMKIGDLLKYQFNLPPLSEQKEIARILSDLDKKIELNTQINQTLEQIAQALFKSWFVDFDPVRAKVQALSDGMSLEQAELAAIQAISGKTAEELTALSQTQPDRYAELTETAKAFPCEMVEVDGVEVPRGWELSTIGDCYDVVMGQSPKGETYNENKQGMLFYQGRAEFGWRFPTPRLFTTDPKRIAEQNSILMSVRAPVGDINIALEKCCIGRGLAALQHKSKSLSFGLYQIQSIKSELDLFNGEGTVFGSINQANLKNIQIINPDEKFIQLFEKYLSSCDSKIMNNEIENNALKEIRDLLLPRLLDGEI
ncbi:restriction endonuclease subunit S [Haemophilus influenzae]|uniref:restriction endonuclease subunit S n=1 Tax=Haemophilus influenzae TaxID=727 RepID=UPI000F6CA00B|nr:restriction endonuclease subunit S [Haemophilus influenzae]VEI55786.1 type I restriction/modification specificity protein [Haemophilus influenzae]